MSVFVFIFMLFSACGIIEQPKTMFHSIPSTYNEILSAEQKIQVAFPHSVDRSSAESIFHVQYRSANIKGDYVWEGGTVYFTPDSPLIHGRRYTLTFSGSYNDDDGNAYSAKHIVPFFIEKTSQEVLKIIKTEPASGEEISTQQTLHIHSSHPVTIHALRHAITITPSIQYSITQEDSKKHANAVFTIHPKQNWEAGSVYTVKIAASLRTADGIPLSKERVFVFTVPLKSVIPKVTRISAAVNNFSDSFPIIGDTLNEDLQPKDAIRIQFSEAMKKSETEKAVIITPFAHVVHIWLNQHTLILQPRSQWSKTHLLTIADTAQDIHGNTIRKSIMLPFQPVQAGSITAELQFVRDGVTAAFSENYTTIQSINVSAPFPSVYSFRIRFHNRVFTDAKERAEVSSTLDITPLFPDDASPPILVQKIWISNSELTVEYSGFTASTHRQHYYVLTIGGGSLIQPVFKYMIRTLP